MKKINREVLNKAAEEKFDLGQQIIKAALHTQQKDHRAQKLIDDYKAAQKRVDAAVKELCKVKADE